MRPGHALTIAAAGVVLAGSAPASAGPRAVRLRVSSAERACGETTLSVPVTRPAGRAEPRLEDAASGQAILCQVAEDAEGPRLWWLNPAMVRGERRELRLTWGRVLAEVGRGLRPAPGGAAVARPAGDAVEILLEGALFTRYVFSGVPKPFCHPLIGPTGQPVTRAYPMEEVAGEPRDHPHHRSLWFAHGEVNGVDFWLEGPRAGKIVHRAFERLESGPLFARIRARSDWVAPDGRKVCEDVRELRAYRSSPGRRALDFEVGIVASEGDVELGDTKEGTFALRVAASMQAKGGGGRIRTADGASGAGAWGKSGAWCAYWGPVGAATVGIALMDHPANVYHPTHWMVRDYGLFAANPFGLRHFTGDRTGKGRCRIPKGETLLLRYRVVIHAGSPDEARVPEQFEEYAEPPRVEVVR